MIALNEYLSNSIAVKKEKIVADDQNIRRILMEEINKYGMQADLNHIDVSNCKFFTGLFSPNYGAYTRLMKEFKKSLKNFNGDISKWDVSNVVDMSNMFAGCKKFNGDLSEWDVSNVKTMQGMFKGCSNFEAIGIDSWDKKSLIKNGDDGMFDGCLKLKRNKSKDDPTTWEVGDILAGTFGYSMTLPRFFKITRKSASQFTCIRLKGKIVSGHRNGQWEEIASDEPYDDKEYKARITKRNTLHIDNVYVKLWDGEALYGDDMD